MEKSGILVLEDGHVFQGNSIGIEGYTVGEVVFNTSITGYQEILTDPSYTEQIITFTFPNIGNVGINYEDQESNQTYIKGIIIRNLSLISSHHRSKQSLQNYLKKNKIIAISNIDTRKLTHILRKTGSQNGCILTKQYNKNNYDYAYTKAKKFYGLKQVDLAKIVSTKKIYNLNYKNHYINKNILINQSINTKKKCLHVVVYDFGIKKNILNTLISYNCKLTVVPAKTPPNTILKLIPDGIFFSNGPGDPRPCNYVIQSIKQFLHTNIPMFGICLGHQLLALASGAKIIKMKFGHHGSNHPVQDVHTKQVMITTQNHGFTVDSNNLPAQLKISHISLFDHTIQGLNWKNKPIFGFQGHPEASPGPHDASSLFDKFIYSMQKI
ncbi:Carbamoyl-phosphate synthase small chain [Buchnera aphidicola (Eriosoma lanigerum)]